MIKLTHYDDGKKNFQSHEIGIKEKCFYNAEYDVTSHNIFFFDWIWRNKRRSLGRLQEEVRLCYG